VRTHLSVERRHLGEAQQAFSDPGFPARFHHIFHSFSAIQPSGPPSDHRRTQTALLSGSTLVASSRPNALGSRLDVKRHFLAAQFVCFPTGALCRVVYPQQGWGDGAQPILPEKGNAPRLGWFPPPRGPDPGLCNAIADCFWFLQPVTATAGDFAVHSRRKIRGPCNRSFCHLFRSIRNLHKINNPSMAPDFDVKGRRMDALPPKRRKDDRKCTSKSASSIYLSHPETSTAKKNETKIPQSHVYL
jgi:hypothetical protein